MTQLPQPVPDADPVPGSGAAPLSTPHQPAGLDPAGAQPAPPLPRSVQRSGQERLARRLRAGLEILICSGVPTPFLIGWFLVAVGLVPAPQEVLTLGFVAPVMLLDTLAVIGLMVWFCRIHGDDPRTLWAGRRPWTREAILGIALVPVVFLMVVILLTTLQHVAPWLHTVPVNPLEELASGSRVDALIFAMVAILAGGLREELQRAFMVSRFEQHLGGARVGVVVLSAAFGVGHLRQGWDAVVTTAAVGAFWAIVYLRRRSSIAPVVSHAGFNALEVLRLALPGA